MRWVYLIIFLCCSQLALAQTALAKQIRGLIKDTASGFAKFRGEIQTQNGVSSYISLINLEETNKNEIFRVDTLSWSYSAIIADSLKVNRGKKVCDEWKQKILLILGGAFVVEQHKTVSYNPVAYGWKFSKDGLTISITMMPVLGPQLSRVFLVIHYWSITTGRVKSL